MRVGIKEILAERYQGFISLDSLLSQMAEAENESYQDAAEALLMLLENFEDTAPKWRVMEKSKGTREAMPEEINGCFKMIESIAIRGVPDDFYLDSDDESVPF